MLPRVNSTIFGIHAAIDGGIARVSPNESESALKR